MQIVRTILEQLQAEGIVSDDPRQALVDIAAQVAITGVMVVSTIIRDVERAQRPSEPMEAA